jgi:hypothetical protein
VDGETAHYIEAERGVEGFLAELRADLKARTFQPLPVRQRAIPKAGGKARYPGIPVIMDRCHQARVRQALEPEWEARFEPRSYGFRPGRGCADAIAALFTTLSTGRCGCPRPNGFRGWPPERPESRLHRASRCGRCPSCPGMNGGMLDRPSTVGGVIADVAQPAGLDAYEDLTRAGRGYRTPSICGGCGQSGDDGGFPGRFYLAGSIGQGFSVWRTRMSG